MHGPDSEIAPVQDSWWRAVCPVIRASLSALEVMSSRCRCSSFPPLYSTHIGRNRVRHIQYEPKLAPCEALGNLERPGVSPVLRRDLEAAPTFVEDWWVIRGRRRVEV